MGNDASSLYNYQSCSSFQHLNGRILVSSKWISVERQCDEKKNCWSESKQLLQLHCTNQTKMLKSDLHTCSCCFWALLRRNVSQHNWTIVFVMSCSLFSHISNFQFPFLPLPFIFIFHFSIFYFPFFSFFHLLIYNFQVLPYWGNQGDRKSLRKYWTQVHYLYLWQGSKITIKN